MSVLSRRTYRQGRFLQPEWEVTWEDLGECPACRVAPGAECLALNSPPRRRRTRRYPHPDRAGRYGVEWRT